MVLIAQQELPCCLSFYFWCFCSRHHAAQNNAQRQLYVNHVAESVGAGTGTAFEDGVPGVYGYGRVGYGYGHQGYGNGYGYGTYGGYGNGYEHGNGYGNGYGYQNNYAYGKH